MSVSNVCVRSFAWIMLGLCCLLPLFDLSCRTAKYLIEGNSNRAVQDNNFWFIFDRFNMDSSWSETGDRYLLKLFRDYVFHQVTETGAPWLDLAHIVCCLNKVQTRHSTIELQK